jgi:hypothetical protein
VDGDSAQGGLFVPLITTFAAQRLAASLACGPVAAALPRVTGRFSGETVLYVRRIETVYVGSTAGGR